MPELPEVEIIKRQLNKEIVGYKISDVWYDTPKMLKSSVKEFVEGVKGKAIVGIGRRAKLLVFVLTDGKLESLKVPARGEQAEKPEDTKSFFVVHLRLSGRLFVRGPDEPPDDYVHIFLELMKGKEKLQLRFAETRKLGYMQYIESEKELEKILSEFGPEPLNSLTKERFREILQGIKRKIKEVLMDQKTIAGVGNIYANEALWLAKIHPEIQSDSLSVSQVDSLFKSLGSVLKEGLTKGGASDQWYRQVHGEMGHYQESFKVYRQVGKPCLQCGSKIKRVEVSGRGTFYCPKCQKK